MSLFHRRAAHIGLQRFLVPRGVRRHFASLQPPSSPIDQSVQKILTLLKRHANEQVKSKESHSFTKLEHALRAADLAAKLDMGDELVIAALLHNCVHVVPQASLQCSKSADEACCDNSTGSNWLRKHGFSGTVCELVELNLDAKRYLCHVDQRYRECMIANAEVAQHGGAMTAEEAAAFQSLDSFQASLALCHCCDEAASLREDECQASQRPGLRRYRGLLEDHLGEQFAHQLLWEDLGQPGTYHVKR